MKIKGKINFENLESICNIHVNEYLCNSCNWNKVLWTEKWINTSIRLNNSFYSNIVKSLIVSTLVKCHCSAILFYQWNFRGWIPNSFDKINFF